ncbi:hypothetical protein [Acidovorax sp. Root568]|uniref:hypothetical protein n=1 Tax=Acidovorax sp. Root568 TaxID=1736565 RepID=UPI0006F6DF61|nr:hypothetical protein [Acidovorax sp. Root568]KRA13217.1 hypothetical protein ASD75_08420 [Acidovorax sp. Root568]
MKKYLALLAAALLQTGAWAATYTFAGPTYTSLQDYSAPCAVVTCANFNAAMQQTGHFTTSQPLPPNQSSLDIAPLITWYDFNDGVTSYTMNGLNTRLATAKVSTDAAGQIVDTDIVFQWWQTGSHGVGDRLSYMSVNFASYFNRTCTSLESPDVCNTFGDDSAASHGFAHFAEGSDGWTSDVPVVAPGGPQSVPVDNPFALALTAAGLLGLALRARQKLLFKT